MHAGISCLIERFPELTTRIWRSYRADPEFREMCSDYTVTLEALARWQASQSSRRAARIGEYQELAQALEIEILTALGLPGPSHGNDRPDQS